MCFWGRGIVSSFRSLVVPQSRGLIGALLRRSQAFSVILRRSQSIARLPVVPQSRCLVVPESVWVGKNLPAMREGDPQSERSEAFFEGKEREEDPQCGRGGVCFLGVGYRLVVPQSRSLAVS